MVLCQEYNMWLYHFFILQINLWESHWLFRRVYGIKYEGARDVKGTALWRHKNLLFLDDIASSPVQFSNVGIEYRPWIFRWNITHLTSWILSTLFFDTFISDPIHPCCRLWNISYNRAEFTILRPRRKCKCNPQSLATIGDIQTETGCRYK